MIYPSLLRRSFDFLSRDARLRFSLLYSCCLRSGLTHRAHASSVSGKAQKSVYVCSDCGADASKWAGQCAACGAWDSMKRFAESAATMSPRNISMAAAAQQRTVAKVALSSPLGLAPQRQTWLGNAAKGAGGGVESLLGSELRLVPLSSVAGAAKVTPRVLFESRELDRLFGGGLVPGSVTLVGGPPGVGKSTLLLQMAALLCRGQRDGRPYREFFTRHGGPPEGPSRGADDDAHALGARSEFPAVSAHEPSVHVAYISGEETVGQLYSRASRLEIDVPGLLALNETRVEDIVAQLEAMSSAIQRNQSRAINRIDAEVGINSESPCVSPPFAAVIIDSIQTMFTDSSPSAAGTVTQVRECAVRLLQYAKLSGVPVLLVGHVTKSGDLAGPRVLEHLVDAVMLIEGEESVSSGSGRSGGTASGGDGGSAESLGGNHAGGIGHRTHRLVRCIKNRFGSTSELALLEMTHEGLVESQPARLFLSRSPIKSGEQPHGSGDAGGSAAPAGSAVAVVLEGSRPLCIEVQALTTRTPYPYPRHRAMGVQLDRVALLLAVINRHARAVAPPPLAALLSSDVFVNVSGGLRVSDPAADLAVALALVSSALSIPLPPDAIFLGEVGLHGEVRPASGLHQRLASAAQLGFRRAFARIDTPQSQETSKAPRIVSGVEVIPVKNIAEAVTAVFEGALRYSPGGATRGRDRRSSERPRISPAESEWTE